MADNVPQQQLPEQVKSDNFVSVYSNSAILDVTPWDFKFQFGAWLKPEGTKGPRVENKVEIIMSPQHAKALLGMLKFHIEQYEKSVGEIKLPASVPPEESAKRTQ